MVEAKKGRGGARPGAGRKPKPKPEPVRIEAGEGDMLKLLQDVALGRLSATPLQVRAAIAAVQYTHTKMADGGKKDAKLDAAKKAGTGRFSAAPPPLRVVGR